MDLDDMELRATREKSADEMFKELGYTETEKYKNGIEYIDLVNDESIEFTDYENYGKTVKATKFPGITIPELKAIYKYCQERGWLE